VQGNTILFPFDDTWTGAQLKREIAERYHVPVPRQTLLVSGKPIADAQLLSAQGIQVHFLRRMLVLLDLDSSPELCLYMFVWYYSPRYR
jgi:hypothetical protein